MKKGCIRIILSAALSACSAAADRIVFKNGRSLDCTILAETPDYLEISLGGGAMNIPRDQLANIIKGGPAKPASKREPSFADLLNSVAPQHAQIAAEFRQLLQQRNAAADAQSMAARHQEQLRNLDRQHIQLREAVAETSRQIEEKSAQSAAIELPKYNPYDNTSVMRYRRKLEEKMKLKEETDVLIAQVVQIAAQGDAVAQRRKKIDEESRTDHQPVVAYRQSLDQFAAAFDAHRQRFLNPDAQTTALFALIDRYVARFRDEIPANKIDFRIRGNATIVRVLINDTLSGEFVLDTGAEVMTISETFAQKLGMRIEELPIDKGILADGSIIDVRHGMLRSVAVGDARVEGVRCGVVNQTVECEADGLLGMSFLKHFSVHHNQTTGELVFSRFEPKE